LALPHLVYLDLSKGKEFVQELLGAREGRVLLEGALKVLKQPLLPQQPEGQQDFLEFYQAEGPTLFLFFVVLAASLFL
jgi:hypothetical protein